MGTVYRGLEALGPALGFWWLAVETVTLCSCDVSIVAVLSFHSSPQQVTKENNSDPLGKLGAGEGGREGGMRGCPLAKS